MKKSIVIALHLLYWLPRFWNILNYTNLTTRKVAINYPGVLYYILTVELIASLISFYVFYFWLFPKFMAKKRTNLFVIYGCVSMITIFIFSVISLKLIGTSLEAPNYSLANLSLRSYGLVINILYSSLIGSAFIGFNNWYADIKVKEQLVQKNLQSELALLKAQINPHFLFNTINNIDILIQKDATAASRYLNQLSDMMRFMLYETSSEMIPLSKELEYIKKYIELQKIRTANEKYVNLSITGSEENVMIAPAIFIPFIENAFKHSTNKKIENAINISIEIEKNVVTFSCLNYFENSASFKQTESGLGIELIKQRLRLLYHENHHLEIVKQENQYEVKLKLKTA